MHDGKLHVKSKRELERLLQKQQRRKTDAEFPEIEGAGKILERIQKTLEKMDGRLKTVEGRTGKMWKAFTEGRGDENADLRK